MDFTSIQAQAGRVEYGIKNILNRLLGNALRAADSVMTLSTITDAVDESGAPTTLPAYVAPDIPSFTDDAPVAPTDFYVPFEEFDRVDPITLDPLDIPDQMAVTVTILDALIAKLSDEMDGTLVAAETNGWDRARLRLDDEGRRIAAETSVFFSGRGWSLDGARARQRVESEFAVAAVEVDNAVLMAKDERRRLVLEISLKVEGIIRDALKTLFQAKGQRNKDIIAMFSAKVAEYAAKAEGSAAKTTAYARVKDAELSLYKSRVEGFKAMIDARDKTTSARIDSAKADAVTAVGVLEAQVSAYGSLLGARGEMAKNLIMTAARVAAASFSAINMSGAFHGTISLGDEFSYRTSSSHNRSTSNNHSTSTSFSRGTHCTTSYPDTYTNSRSIGTSVSKNIDVVE